MCDCLEQVAQQHVFLL